MLQPGVVIGGRFRVDRVLGEGGMGVVVAATHLELGQHVALKVLHDELAANPMIVARFLREARAVAQLRTDHVCRVFDVGRQDNGAPFIVMEMLDGSDLGAVVVRGAVPMVIAVEYVIQACVALAEAHAAGLVHRDIKPPNLFVVRRSDGGPLVKVLDFGIAKAATAAEAKLTQTTSTMGSPGYMSPEQIRSTRDVDLRTDIWALGVTLYQLLSGRLPFGGTQLAEIAVAVMTAAPAPLEVDASVRAIVMRCLEKEPEKRFASVAELAVALMPFGGPSAPHFVREITRGAVGGPDTPPPAMVPMHAPTAASMIGPMPISAATGANVAPMMGMGYAAPTAQPPMPHGTAPAMAAGTSPHGPPPVPATSGRGKWVAFGVILVVVLVGGGALAGWLARGTDKHAVHDAGVATGSGSGSAVVAMDAGVVATASDAAVTIGHDADPWNETHADPVADTAQDEAMAATRAQMEMARNMMSDDQKKQTLAQLHTMESQLEKTKKSNPTLYQQQLVGFISAACYMADAAMAQRMFDKVTSADYREASMVGCKQMGVTLVDNSAKKN